MSHPADAWMPFYGEDFLGSETVIDMEPLARWLYWNLLWRQWRHGHLPLKPENIRKLIPGDMLEDWPRLWPQIEVCFPVVGAGRANARCTFERGLAEGRIDRRTAKAKKMAQTRWKAPPKEPRSMLEHEHKHMHKDEGQDRTGPDGPERTDRTGTDTLFAADAAVATPKPRKLSEAHSTWQAEWSRHRPGAETYLLTGTDAVILNKLGKEHGIDALRLRASALLADTFVGTFKNACPEMLVKKWSQLGTTNQGEQTTAVRRMKEQIADGNSAPVFNPMDALTAAGRKRLTQ